MKVETTVFLLCFLSGIFLPVIYAKPSPELMKELIALEKYLQKKDGSDGDAGQNDIKDGTNTDVNPSVLDENQNLPQENQQTDGQDEPMNENNKDKGDDANNAKGPSGVDKPTDQDEAAPPGKPEDEVPPKNAEEGSGVNDQVPTSSNGNEEEEKPQEGNNQEGLVETGRDKLFTVFTETIIKIKDLVDKLDALRDEFRKLFKEDDSKFVKLEDKVEQAKQKTKEKLNQLKTVADDIQIAVGLGDAPGKKSVRENAPARRSQLSDTEFLNLVQSLLANN